MVSGYREYMGNTEFMFDAFSSLIVPSPFHAQSVGVEDAALAVPASGTLLATFREKLRSHGGRPT
jgi:hypothetical protein